MAHLYWVDYGMDHGLVGTKVVVPEEYFEPEPLGFISPETLACAATWQGLTKHLET